jgi:hypothetical protein
MDEFYGRHDSGGILPFNMHLQRLNQGARPETPYLGLEWGNNVGAAPVFTIWPWKSDK